MARRQSSVLSTLMLGLLFSMLACGGPNHSEEKYYLIAGNTALPYWQNAKSGLESASSQYKIPSQFAGPREYSAQGEVEEFRKAVRENASGILVSPIDPEMMRPEIDAAIAAGIPVITMDSDAPQSKRLFFIGTNNYQAGITGGEVAAERLKGKGNVVVFTMPNQTNLSERLDGYKTVLARHPGIKIVEVIDIRGDARIAFDRTDQLLAGKNRVDGFICLEASACKDVAEVLERRNATDRVVVAMDTDRGTLDAVEKGVIAATIAQKPATMASFGLLMLDQIRHMKIADLGKDWSKDSSSPFPRFIDTGAVLVTKENVSQFRPAGSQGSR